MEKRVRTLIADSSEDFGEHLRQALERGGECEVAAVVQDGTRAAELLRELTPEVLILDLALPGMDGLRVLREAAGLEKRPMTLATCSFLTDYVAQLGAELGVQYFLRKPCDAATVASHVAEMLEAGRRSQSGRRQEINRARHDRTMNVKRHNLFTMTLPLHYDQSPLGKRKALRPLYLGTKGRPSAVPPAFAPWGARSDLR